MECEAIKRLINRQIDEELEARDEGTLREHLDGCPECRAFRDDLLKIRQIFAAQEAPAPSAAFSRRVLQAARDELAEQRARGIVFLARRVAAAALILAVLTVGFVLVTGTDPVQAVDKDMEIHYEDLFLEASPDQAEVLGILLRTDNPREALRIYSSQRRP